MLELAFFTIAIQIYSMQLVWLFRKYGKLIRGLTRLVLIVFWLYMAARLAIAAYIVIEKPTFDHTSLFRSLYFYLKKGSIVIFQVLMFRLARIEIFMNPKYSDAGQVRKKLC